MHHYGEPVHASRSTSPLTIADWQRAQQDGAAMLRSLAAMVRQLREQPDPAWIHLASDRQLDEQFDALSVRLARDGCDALPLYGVPFAVKDNLDVAGWPTTAACPAFACTATATATVVQRLLEHGAIVIGKTNLDQFATGLVGTRSPYGVVPNTFDPRFICGGSSSGSASVVARGLVPFALGTDTAGSGRVPAGLNNLVGLKPTRGRFSSRGMLPACRTLDCVSVFATTVADADRVATILSAFDPQDPFSRPVPEAVPAALPAALRIGVPATLDFHDDDRARAAFDEAVRSLAGMGATLVPFDPAPLHEVTQLLYDGPWIAERHLVLRDLMAHDPDAIHPVVRRIVAAADGMTAADAFDGLYRLAALQRRIEPLWQSFDLIVVPTTPGVWTIEQVLADPVALNSRMGRYTNFVNLLDWCALALPAGRRDDGLPAGITVLAPAWRDTALVAFGHRWQQHRPWPLGNSGRMPAAAQPGSAPPAITLPVITPPVIAPTAIAPPTATSPTAAPQTPPPEMIRVAVVGAHLSGMALNHQLTSRAATLVEQTHTAGTYRLFALKGTVPPKPGLLRVARGEPIVVELWDVPADAFGSFVAEIPPPLGIGTLELIDGRQVKGFICEPIALADADDITAHGGWRAYIASRSTADGPDRAATHTRR